MTADNATQLVHKIYYEDGEIKNGDGKPLSRSNRTGVKAEKWFLNGKLHNDNGPAVIKYFNGIISDKYNYIHGVFRSEEVMTIHEISNIFKELVDSRKTQRERVRQFIAEQR